MESCDTEAGIQIDEREKHPENAQSPMHDSSEPDSNITVEIL
jgi:hypothetical protein